MVHDLVYSSGYGLVPKQEQLLEAALRAFSLLLCTVKRREVRLFLRKSHVGSGSSVYTRSENALGIDWMRQELGRASFTVVSQESSGRLIGLAAAKPC